jgi:hypothetical protein
METDSLTTGKPTASRSRAAESGYFDSIGATPSDLIFADDFETGDTQKWSSVSP